MFKYIGIPIILASLMAEDLPPPTNSPLPINSTLPTETPPPTNSPLPEDSSSSTQSPPPRESPPPPQESPPPPHEPYEIDGHGCEDGGNTQLYPPENASYQERDDGGFNEHLEKPDGGSVKFEVPLDGQSMKVQIKNADDKGKETNFRPPPCSDIKFDDNGGFVNRIEKDNFSVELNSSSTGDFQLKYDIEGRKPLKINAPAGSNARIEDNGSFYNYVKLDNDIESELESDYFGNSKFTIKPKGREPIRIKAPTGVDINISENGVIKQSLELDTKKSHINVDEDGDIKASVKHNEIDRFFKPVYGSDISLSDDGNISSNKSKVVNDINLSTNIEINDGSLKASIYSKDSNTNKRDYIDSDAYIYIEYDMSVYFLDGGIDIIASWFEDDSNTTLRETKDISDGYFDINISSNTPFIFPDKASSSDSIYLTITPNSISTFNQKIYFDNNQTLLLSNGDVNISGKIGEIELNLNSINSINIDKDGNYLFKSKDNSIIIDRYKQPYLTIGSELFYKLSKDINDINISFDDKFILEYTSNSNQYLDEINYIDVNKSARFEEVISSDRTLKLLSGEAILNSKRLEVGLPISLESIRISTRDKKDINISITNGWNLKSNPNNSLFKSNFTTLFTYSRGLWEENPSYLEPIFGYWIYSKQPQKIDFNGSLYEFNISNLPKNRWLLMGASKELILDSNQSISYKYTDEWIKNPQKIDTGEGFWIKNY